MDAEKAYRAADGLNYSTLKHLRQSPLHYQYQLEAPRKDMPAWVMGRLIHLLTFEPFAFEDTYFVWEGRKDKRTKAYQAAVAEADGREVVSPDQHEQALRVAARITNHPTMRALLSRPDVQCEKPLFWELDGRACKGKPDLYVVGDHEDGKTRRHLLLDLKTFNTTDAHQVRSTAFRYGWHLQVAHYLSGIAALHGEPTEVEAYLLVAEQDSPHDVRCFQWDDLSLELAQKEHRDLLDLLAQCEKTNHWPGRGDFGELSPPAWLLSIHETEGGF